MKTMCAWLLPLLFVCALSATAQRRLTVVDVETRVPVGDANVAWRGQVGVTDSLGGITLSDSVRTLVFSHVNYESRIVNREEVRDTVFLISKLLNLREVVVFGQWKGEDELKRLKKQLRMQKIEAELAAINPAAYDMLPVLRKVMAKLFPSKKKKRRERLKRILEEY